MNKNVKKCKITIKRKKKTIKINEKITNQKQNEIIIKIKCLFSCALQLVLKLITF